MSPEEKMKNLDRLLCRIGAEYPAEYEAIMTTPFSIIPAYVYEDLSCMWWDREYYILIEDLEEILQS